MGEVKPKNITRTIFLVIICLIILAGYTLFNGPPFGQIIANYKIQKYVSIMYDDSEISKPWYNYISNFYHVKRYDNRGNNSEIRYYLYNNLIGDELLSDGINTHFNADLSRITKGFPGNIKIPYGYLSTSIYANGNYALRIEDLTIRQGLYILGIVNSDVDIT